MTLKSIPNPINIPEPHTRLWAIAITQAIKVLLGRSGDASEQPVKQDTLSGIGSIGVERSTERLFRKPLSAIDPVGEGYPRAAAAASPQQFAFAAFDASDGIAIGEYLLPFYVPQDSYVTLAYYDVLTPFTSATDAATIAIGIDTDDDDGLLNAIAINDLTLPFAAGVHACIQDGTVVNFSAKTTERRAIKITVANEALTAGKLKLFVNYSTSG